MQKVLINSSLILELNPNHPRAEVAAQRIWAAARRANINTELRVSHFMAQLAHESSLVPQQENLRYSTRRLMQVWPSRFPSWYSALPYTYNPFMLANKVYGRRMGNVRWDDGYRYRGRGFIQLTGRSNYRKYGRLIGYDLERNPDLCLQYGISALVACAYWNENNLSNLADQDNISEITRRINGGWNGLGDRRYKLVRAKMALGIMV